MNWLTFVQKLKITCDFYYQTTNKNKLKILLFYLKYRPHPPLARLYRTASGFSAQTKKVVNIILITSLTSVQVIPSPVYPFGQSPHWNDDPRIPTLVHETLAKHGFLSQPPVKMNKNNQNVKNNNLWKESFYILFRWSVYLFWAFIHNGLLVWLYTCNWLMGLPPAFF